jgi:hypothetical protein
LHTVQTDRQWHCAQKALVLQGAQSPVLVIPSVLGEHPVQTGDAGGVTIVQLAHPDILVHAPAVAVLTGHTAGGGGGAAEVTETAAEVTEPAGAVVDEDAVHEPVELIAKPRPHEVQLVALQFKQLAPYVEHDMQVLVAVNP